MSTELLKATLGSFDDMKAELESLRQENSRLREALQWYADFMGTTEMEYDLGKRARAALE